MNKPPTPSLLRHFALILILLCFNTPSTNASSPLETAANGLVDATPPNTCTGNLITNPGFESGLTDWTTVGNVTISTDANSGTTAAALSGSGYSSIGMIFPTSPGMDYDFSVWAKSAGPNSYKSVSIRFLNSSYIVIPTLGTGDLSIGSSYTHANYQVTAPVGAVYVYAIAYKDGPGSLLVDDWCLTEQGSTFLPDLVVSNIQVPLALNTGVPFNFSCLVKNNGLAPAPACNLRISLGSGLDIGNLPVPPLTVGQELTLNGQFNLPAGAGFGTGVVQAEIDLPDNIVQESNEINNWAVSDVVSLNNIVTCTGSVGTPTCNDNGTPANPNDDLFSFNINIGTNAPNPPFTSWVTTINGQVATGNYGTPTMAGPFPISIGAQSFTVSGYQCTLPLTISPPAPCSNSGGNGQIDLSLALQQLTTSPAQWSSYHVKATLTNAGPQAATGVKVKFAKPAGVVYVGGNEFTATQGSFNPNGDEVWTVGSIPANGSATLTVNYFLLNTAAPVAYAQVIAANETDSDSQPNNGTPPTPVQDDEASTAGVGNPTPQPDLTISDLQIPTSTVAAGAILNYNFDASNTGTAAVPGNFTIKSYISADQTLSANDVQDGTIPTGNYGIGFSVQNVAGASTIPASLAAGQYYLLVKIDADDMVAENNEANNWVAMPFTVTGGSSSCENTIANGQFVCTSQPNPNQVQVLSRTVSTPYQYTQTTLNADGQVLGTQSVTMPSGSYFTFAGNVLSKYNDENGSLIYTKTIPAPLFNSYAAFRNVAEYNNGYVLFAYKHQNQADVDSLFAIKTDANLNPISSRFLFLGGHLSYNGADFPLQIAPNRVAFFLRIGTGVGNEKLRLVVLDEDLNIKSNTLWLNSGNYSVSARLRQSPCGGFSILTQYTTSFCIHGACSTAEESFGEFINDEFRWNRFWGASEQSTMGQGLRSNLWGLRYADGSILNGQHFQTLPIGTFPLNDTIRLSKTLGNTVIWEKKLLVPGAQFVKEFREVSGHIVFIKENPSTGVLSFVNATCLEGGTPPPPGDCNAITITPAQGKITIAGFNAPHVLIKVFRPNWTVAYECLDGACSNPLVVSGLTNGSHYVEMKLMNAYWGEICTKTQTVGVNNLAAPDDARQRLSFDKVYPNPAKYSINLELYSPEAQPAVLDFYDQQGRVVYSLKTELEEGSNNVQVFVFDWKSGTYNVIARGEKTGLPAYGRFLKVWEE